MTEPPNLGDTMTKFTQEQIDFIADRIAPTVAWPPNIVQIAREIALVNPDFDTDKFMKRAGEAWEAKYQGRPLIEDEIPY